MDSLGLDSLLNPLSANLICSRQHLFFFFFFFFFSNEMSRLILSEKKRKKKCHLLQILLGSLRVKTCHDKQKKTLSKLFGLTEKDEHLGGPVLSSSDFGSQGPGFESCLRQISAHASGKRAV